jgi:four helix bundle protein
MHDFKNLLVWNKGLDIVEDVYRLSSRFPEEEKFGLTSQVRRSAVSIPSNIAEGAYRNTNGEFRQFLGIARGSGGELYTQLIIANRLGFVSSEDITPLINRIDINNKKISSLIYSFK